MTADTQLAGVTMALPILQMRGVTKRFPGTIALDHVDLTVERGEVHALVGENGAGKSSLIKVVCGVYQADEGDMQYEGAPYEPLGPLDALRAGIRVVYQDFNLLTSLSVAENLLFERLPSRLGVLDRATLHRRALELLEQVGLDVSPSEPVERLGVAQRQLLEIAKSLAVKSKVIIMDEPTATLTSRETARLFEIIGRLRASGVTIIFISHHLQEIFEIGDRVTVLRNGRKVETKDVRQTSPAELVHLMVGRRVGSKYPFHDEVQVGGEALRVESLRYHGNPNPISFSVHYGEILGIAGLVGSGRTETVRAIFGADRRQSGEFFRDGKQIKISGPQDAIRHGICLLTENRKDEGLVLPMEVRVNITLTDLARISTAGVLQPEAERSEARHLTHDLDIRLASLDQFARDLSGGNQQKLVLAKWVFRKAQIMILDEPTRGIDVGAKAEIYDLLWRLAAEGKAIIVVSSDLPELLGICHRLLVLSKGHLTGVLQRREFDQEKVLSLAYQEYMKPYLQAGTAAVQ
ncbi:MAG TPA: sugar ABC transporter ATP-binding protein [Burkholderiales bacterium]|nr:sugar ABC transporter ATP-binding protein [Burkholderiales bacterium]